MARGPDHLERVGAEGNGVVLLQVTAHGRLLVLGELLAHKLLGLLREGADERLVVLVKLHLQAPGVEHKLVANVVVHVSVGGQQVYGAQVVALYIVLMAWRSASNCAPQSMMTASCVSSLTT